MAPPDTGLSLSAAESIVIGALALLFAIVAWRTHDRGLGWLVAGFGLAAAWYGFSDHLPPAGPEIDTPLWRVASIVIALAVLCVSAGVVRYLGPPEGAGRWALAACAAPAAVQISWLAVGGRLSHGSFHAGVLGAYFGAGLLALRRGAQAPGDGHALLGAALLALALLPLAMALLGLPADQLKDLAGLLLTLFGMALLTVTLLRRQRLLDRENARRAAADVALRDANHRLEARVADRTAHLNELISGLESFNHGVSHDLRGPLGGMSRLARLALEALDRDDPSFVRRALPTIAAQCDTSMGMVETMLDLARIGARPLRLERVDLQALVHTAYEEVLLGQPAGPAPELRCGPLPEVIADAGLLRRVLVNLLGNALKFAGGTPQARVQVEAVVDGRSVTVGVRDNGPGFDPAEVQRLFEPFYRGRTARTNGHGLGLSIVRRAVQAMGGKVSASVPPGGGAAVQFTLPEAVPAATGHDAGAATAPSGPARLQATG